MKARKKRLVIDLETRSECDLKLCGVSQYVRDPSTEVICVGYKIDKKRAKLWWPILGEEIPEELREALEDEEYRIVAHNVPFEWSVFEFVIRKKYDIFIPHLPIFRWRCTATKAASHALPRKLADAAKALGLPVLKDDKGHKIMLKMSKPRPTWKKNKTGDKYFWKEDEVKKLGEYCITDVEVEALLDDALPDLPANEVRVWHLDQRINLNGVTVDLPLVKKILRLIKENNDKLHKEFRELTDNKVQSPTQVAETLALLHDDLDVYLPNLKAATVLDVLTKDASGEEPIDPTARRILEIRQSIAKSSTKKFKAFVNRTNKKDFKLRDILLYWGASTGRWAGQGVQLQNLPSKIKVENVDLAISVIELEDIELMSMLYKNNMEVFSSVIRSMITASPGKSLFVGDFAAIEARVLFWLAEYEAGLKLFREGKDLYVEEAASIYNKAAKNITKLERALGKVAILALGYGMGEGRAYETAIEWGVKDVTPEMASKMVKGYRKRHAVIPQLWKLIEKAAIAAVQNPGKEYPVTKVKWVYNEDNKFLYCILPSGRKLAYYGPEIKKGKTPWGDVRPVLYHWGVDSKTKVWKLQKTYGGLLVENICQAIARDLMVESMFNLEEAGYLPLVTVHDEIVTEAKEGSVEEFEDLMRKVPKWGKGCPVEVEAWKGRRYRK